MRYICKKKTLLELTLDQDFQDLPYVTVTSIDLMPDDARIRSEAEGSYTILYYIYCWFVEEMVLPMQCNQLRGELQDHAGAGASVQTLSMDCHSWV